MFGKALIPSPPSGDVTIDINELDDIELAPITSLTTPLYPQSTPPEPANIFDSFADELLIAIFQHLPPEDIYKLSFLDKRFHRICTEMLRHGSRPEDRRWKIGFFRTKQNRLNDDIDELHENKSKCTHALSLIGVGGTATGITGKLIHSISTAQRFVSSDEKILVAVFFVLSLLVLLGGIAKLIGRIKTDHDVNKLNYKIEDLNTQIAMEAGLLRSQRPI